MPYERVLCSFGICDMSKKIVPLDPQEVLNAPIGVRAPISVSDRAEGEPGQGFGLLAAPVKGG